MMKFVKLDFAHKSSNQSTRNAFDKTNGSDTRLDSFQARTNDENLHLIPQPVVKKLDLNDADLPDNEQSDLAANSQDGARRDDSEAQSHN